MHEILEAVADGDLSPAAAEAELRGYVQTDAGRFDTTRENRTGIPEGIIATGKTPEEIAMMVVAAVETTGSALVTRIRDDDVTMSRTRLTESFSDFDFNYDERSQTLVVHGPDYDPPDVSATATIVTAGTSDAFPAGEAAVVLTEAGVTVEQINDVGVAGIARLFDQLDAIREADVLVVAAGREGALPTVLAGLVEIPLIGLPVSTGYGYGGAGEAALAGMLQSCAPIVVVNIDAGFTAGAQASLIAKSISAARHE